jgi:hypothetical protein
MNSGYNHRRRVQAVSKYFHRRVQQKSPSLTNELIKQRAFLTRHYASAQTSAPFSTNSFDFASIPFFSASSPAMP